MERMKKFLSERKREGALRSLAPLTRLGHGWVRLLDSEEKLLEIFHSISSNTLYDYVAELSSDYYEGRLTGTEGYDLAAEWVATKFQDWGIKPGGDDSTYFQDFPIPYTLVFPGCEVYLHIPYKNSFIKKYYRYEDEFIPGST